MRAPDHNDADLILKLYELRRETVMRQARGFWFQFFPKSYEEVKAVMDPQHPQNAYFRQVTSYWEMASSFVNHHILHPDLFTDNCGEGLYLFAKLEPFLAQIRETMNPAFLGQMGKTIAENPQIREKLGRIRELVKQRTK